MRNIIADLRAEAVKAGYTFEYVNGAYDINEQVMRLMNGTSQRVMLVLPFTVNDTVENSMVSEYKYTASIWVGRKMELATISDVNETQSEKWDNRLYELINEGNEFLEAFFAPCSTKNYRLDSKRSEQLINRTSENLDFIQIDITFTEWKE